MKILTIPELYSACREWRWDGASIVHCHGCFDPVHLGHILHFEEAKKLGNILVVTLTADAFVRKGPDRPRFLDRDRARGVAAIECVDAVAIVHHETAEGVIATVRPHLFVKGEEYRYKRTAPLIKEERAVEKHGGRVDYVSGPAVYSSTALLAGV